MTILQKNQFAFCLVMLLVIIILSIGCYYAASIGAILPASLSGGVAVTLLMIAKNVFKEHLTNQE